MGTTGDDPADRRSLRTGCFPAPVFSADGGRDPRRLAFLRRHLRPQDQARVFLLESPAKNRVDVKTGTVHGSMIYVKYYREDFGGTDQAIGRYLAGFYPDGPEKQLLLSGKGKLVETDYDWTLNSQEKASLRRVRR